MAGRGDVAAATAPLILLISALTLGLPEALTYWAANRGHTTSRVLPVVVVQTVAVGVLGFVVIFLLSGELSDGSRLIERAMVFSATLLPFALVAALLRGLAIGFGSWKLVLVERLVSAGTRLIGLTLLLVAGQLSVGSASAALSISYGVAVIPYLWLIGHRSLRRSPESARIGTFRESRQVSRYGIGVWAGTVGGIILSRLDQVLLSPLSSPFQLGLYAASINVAEVLLVFNNAVRDVMFARLARSFEAQQLTLVARVSTIICGLFASIIVCIGEPLLRLAFGGAFSAAYTPLVIVTISLWAGCPGSIAGAALNAAGKPLRRSLSLIAGAIVNVCALVLLAPHYGAIGAAVATCLGSVVAANCNILLVRTFGFRARDFYLFRPHDFRVVQTASMEIVRMVSRRALRK